MRGLSKGATFALVALTVAAIPAVFLHDSWLMSTFSAVAILGIALVGLDLVMGYGKLLSFSHGAFLAIGGYVMGILSARAGVPLPLGILAALVVNAGFAYLIARATLKMSGYYLAVATLGFGIIVIQILGSFAEYTGGWSGLTGIASASLFGYRLSSDFQFYLVGATLLVASMWIAYNLMHSRFGRAVRAMGDDDLAAEMLGIDSPTVRVHLFVLSSMFASVAGSLYALSLKVITPGNFDATIAIDMVLMVFLGGKETIWGPILGATVVRLIPELAESLEDYKTVVQGLAFLAVFIFFPEGLSGLLIRLVSRWRRESARVSPSDPADIGIYSRIITNDVANTDAPLLEVLGISKSFAGVQAVGDLSFSLNRGRIKAVIGPNGAGKTTLFNLLTGVLRPDTGEIRFSGRPSPADGTHAIAELGIARTFQTPRLFASMTVLQNVVVGQHRLLNASLANSLVPLAATHNEEQEALKAAGELLSLVGLAEFAHCKVDTLAFGQRRLLEVARALAMRPRVLLVDEPAAGLNETEKRFLGDLLARLRDAGLTILLVEHDMGLVMRLADELLVLDRGRKIAEGVPDEVRRDRAVIDAYLGQELPHVTR